MTYRDINELTPLAQRVCRLFMETCRKNGLDIFITETYRSQKRQNELWEQGRSKPGKIVTWTMHSRHTDRRAWDIACNGSNLYDRVTLKKAGAIAENLSITWGGTWTTPDMPHFEITDNWNAPKEEEEMTQEQFNKFMDNWLAERRNLPVSDWAEKDLEQAKEEGIFVHPAQTFERITGTDAPQAFATREQVAAMILRSKDK